MKLPDIHLEPTKLGSNLDAAETALRTMPVYQMKGSLVHIVRSDMRNDGRPAGALTIKPIQLARTRELLISAARFLRYEPRNEKWVPTTPNAAFVNHLHAREQWEGIRVLTGIVEAPTLRSDGTVLSEPGYDEESGLFLDLGGVDFPPVPENPSRDDALRAVASLKDVIKDFPFVADDESVPVGTLGAASAARSVALSAMMTGVCRKAVRTAPAHAIDATSMETGKTLFCDVVSLLALGRSATAISMGRTTEELGKRLFSILMQGDPVVVIDNIDLPIESDEFCTILTSEVYQGRVLGESKNRSAPTNVLFLLDGNNLRFRGDITTRVIVSRMDTGMERPGDRRFDRDLRVYIPEHRPRLVVDVLTALRAFIIAGRPGMSELRPFARFEEWSNLVRGALVWLDEPDPNVSRELTIGLDPVRESLADLLAAWREDVGSRWVTAAELIKNMDFSGLEEPLRALMNVSSHVTLAPHVVGKCLTSFDGRIVNGACIRKHVTSGHSTKFRLAEEDGF